MSNPTRAHVEGCSKALSVPVDQCPCGGRDIVWPDTPKAELAAPINESTRQLASDLAYGIFEPCECWNSSVAISEEAWEALRDAIKGE